MFSWSSSSQPRLPVRKAATTIGKARASIAPVYRGDTFRATAVRRVLTLVVSCAAASAWAAPSTDPTAERGARSPRPRDVPRRAVAVRGRAPLRELGAGPRGGAAHEVTSALAR